LVAFCQFRRRHIPEDSNHNLYFRDSVMLNGNEPSGILVSTLLRLVEGRTVSG
jgi:hypothetical protein